MEFTGKLSAIEFELLRGYVNEPDITLTLPFSSLVQLQARIAALETELNELRGEYRGLPAWADGPDTSRGTARASVIAAARAIDAWRYENKELRACLPDGLRTCINQLQGAVYYFDHVARPVPPEAFERPADNA